MKHSAFGHNTAVMSQVTIEKYLLRKKNKDSFYWCVLTWTFLSLVSSDGLLQEVGPLWHHHGEGPAPTAGLLRSLEHELQQLPGELHKTDKFVKQYWKKQNKNQNVLMESGWATRVGTMMSTADHWSTSSHATQHALLLPEQKFFFFVFFWRLAICKEEEEEEGAAISPFVFGRYFPVATWLHQERTKKCTFNKRH